MKITQCNRCIMDSSAINFVKFDLGCNFCASMKLSQSKNSSNLILNNVDDLVQNIKASKRDSYDCIIGVSGGVDSSWVLVKAVEAGLKPLAVHFDNGWNSDLSQKNIEALVTKLGVDFETYIVNWREYKQHLKGMFNSNVIDLELLSDNLMNNVVLDFAIKHRVKYILNGVNTSTEGIPLPKNWAWHKLDGTNLKSILKKNSKSKMISIKPRSIINYHLLKNIHRVHDIEFLNYFSFNKNEALECLIEKFNYSPYPFKHYENIFTRVYQGFILPNKFGVDKRKLHFSALIINNELSRDHAISLLNDIPYDSEESLQEDISYVKKKLDMTENYWNEYIKHPAESHEKYFSYLNILKAIQSK
jgi:N-acetyl sugar amidotransferase